MRAIQLSDSEYRKAIAILLGAGGTIQGCGDNVIVVGERQYEVLRQSGITLKGFGDENVGTANSRKKPQNRSAGKVAE